MVNYNPKEWFTFIFRFHKSDTVRKLLPMIVSISVYSAIVAWIEVDYLKLSSDNKLKNLSIMHTMLTFVISTLLVFRTNSAYERWWEGRKLWGSLVNSSRNFAMKIDAILPPSLTTERLFYKTMIGNFPFVLKNHLRNTIHQVELEENNVFQTSFIKMDQHNPNFIAKKIFTYTANLSHSKIISHEQLLLLNTELVNMADVCGACERIRNTPIPYSYSAFLKKFIFFFVMTLPLTLVFSLGYFCVPVVAFIFYVLTSLELIAEEIEDPFGKDENDLPLDNICRGIRKSVNEIFEG